MRIKNNEGDWVLLNETRASKNRYNSTTWFFEKPRQIPTSFGRTLKLEMRQDIEEDQDHLSAETGSKIRTSSQSKQ